MEEDNREEVPYTSSYLLIQVHSQEVRNEMLGLFLYFLVT